MAFISRRSLNFAGKLQWQKQSKSKSTKHQALSKSKAKAQRQKQTLSACASNFIYISLFFFPHLRFCLL